MMVPPRPADSTVKNGRWQKALQFAEAASLFLDDTTGEVELADAYVTLAVHAGIAASDVITIVRGGTYAIGSDSHTEAKALLKKSLPAAEPHLAKLLNIKTKAGYEHRSVSSADVRAAEKAHRTLLDMASAFA